MNAPSMGLEPPLYVAGSLLLDAKAFLIPSLSNHCWTTGACTSSLKSPPTISMSPASFHFLMSSCRSIQNSSLGSTPMLLFSNCRRCWACTVIGPPVGLFGRYTVTTRRMIPSFPWYVVHAHLPSFLLSSPDFITLVAMAPIEHIATPPYWCTEPSFVCRFAVRLWLICHHSLVRTCN